MTTLRPFLRPVLIYLALALVVGVLWSWIASPALTLRTSEGLVLTEFASKDRFGVVVVYVCVSAAVSLVWGLWFGWAFRSRGWVLVPVAVVASLAAALVAYWFGVQVGPPDPTTVAGLKVGDTAPQQLALDTITPLFVWPALALVGIVWSVYLARDVDHNRARERNEVVGR
ncbi:hypothetical protein BH09ACT10_BH09ACT10_02690 [soil metagenome]